MVLDLDANLEQQIELFLMSNGLHYDLEARRKLLQTTTRVQREYFESRRQSNHNTNFHPNNPHSANNVQNNMGSGGMFAPHVMNRSAPSSRPSTANNTVSTIPGTTNSNNTQSLNASR